MARHLVPNPQKKKKKNKKNTERVNSLNSTVLSINSLACRIIVHQIVIPFFHTSLNKSCFTIWWRTLFLEESHTLWTIKSWPKFGQQVGYQDKFPTLILCIVEHCNKNYIGPNKKCLHRKVRRGCWGFVLIVLFSKNQTHMRFILN